MASRHAIYMCCYNNADLTRQAVESALAQDVSGGVDLFIVNNGSTDDGATFDYLELLSCSADFEGSITHLPTNQSPCVVANRYLAEIFAAGYGEVLCCPNDAILSTRLYSDLLLWPRGVVTASMTSEPISTTPAPAIAVNTCTPMAVVLWRNWCYDAIVQRYGYFFCEEFFHYASDMDLALRMSACGIVGVQLSTQYWHYSSASLKMAQPEEHFRMNEQADRDRATFVRRWGFRVTDPAYTEAAGNINFLGKPLA